MKNKTVLFIYIVCAIVFAAYFAALQIASPSVLSFSYFWLFLAALSSYAALRGGKRQDAEKVRKHTARRCIISFLLLCMCIAAINLVFICTPAESDGSAETAYIIVLGGGIRRDGTLTDVPKKRIEKAAEWMKQHPQAKAIVTGGQGKFAPCAEAPVLAVELEKYGIGQERIIQEDNAKDTIQNFEYSAELIAADQNSFLHPVTVQDVLLQPVTVVTSKFHLRRAERLASRMGFKTVYGLGTKTAPLFVVNSYCREIFAYIKLNLRIFLTGKPVRIQPVVSAPAELPLNP
jgi:uncharacterized SAM-binding protein YcdF (DUF218 family)